VIPSNNLLLFMGAVGFYIYDSAMLLYNDELVLHVDRYGWKVMADSGFAVRGRRLVVPNPLLPHQALFRVHWATITTDKSREHVAGLTHFVNSLREMRSGMLLLLGLFVLGLPLALFIFKSPEVLLACLGAIYIMVAVLLIRLYQHRRVFELSEKAFASLAIEALLCTPLALNLVRKICARRGIRGDAMAFTTEALPEVELFAMRSVIDSRIQLAMDFEEAGSPRSNDLEAFRRRLAGLRK
jgi:hypothetical protein